MTGPATSSFLHHLCKAYPPSTQGEILNNQKCNGTHRKHKYRSKHRIRTNTKQIRNKCGKHTEHNRKHIRKTYETYTEQIRTNIRKQYVTHMDNRLKPVKYRNIPKHIRTNTQIRNKYETTTETIRKTYETHTEQIRNKYVINTKNLQKQYGTNTERTTCHEYVLCFVVHFANQCFYMLRIHL
jgi:hypothetical protein